MDKEVYIMGNYLSGISKRPDLVNQSCILIYKEEGFLLVVSNGETGESFKIPYDIVESCTFVSRVVTSEVMLDKSNTAFNSDMLALAFGGATGLMMKRMSGYNDSIGNIGKVDFSKMYQVIVEYRTPERNKRLVINVYDYPANFVEYYNTIKK